MNTNDFNELAGRIEGLNWVVLHMAAALERRDLLNGELLTDSLLRFSEGLDFPGEHLAATKLTINSVANKMETARNLRQELRDQG